MSESNPSDRDLFTPGALLLGGGALAFLGAHWIRERLAHLADLIARTPPAPPPVGAATPIAAPPPAPVPAAAPAAPAEPPASPEAPAPVPSSTPAASTPSGAVSRKFDALFQRYGAGLPIDFLRSLASRESGLNPAERSGPAWGLMQIVEVVRQDFNRRHGTHYSREHLLDPAINVAIGTDLLRLIVGSYARNHADVTNLRTDWRNPRFVELVVFGWNAGFSEGGGVGRVVRHLKARGIRDITIDTVYQHAKAAGASRHLSNEAKVRWCKGVTALYQRERARSERDPNTFPVG
jgi:hypothetical protein